MHTPAIFTETDPIKLKTLIQHYPLATLISVQDGVPQADHLPFYLVDDGNKWTLIAHIAKANPLAAYVDGQDVLITFMGEQGYISPSWYPTKQEHHRHVPTWNYQTVHVRGTARTFSDAKSLLRAVGTLTGIHEATQPTPWKMADAPRDYLMDELGGIVGLAVDVREIVGKFKLSQNREQVDFDGIVENLEQQGQTGLAKAVADTRP